MVAGRIPNVHAGFHGKKKLRIGVDLSQSENRLAGWPLLDFDHFHLQDKRVALKPVDGDRVEGGGEPEQNRRSDTQVVDARVGMPFHREGTQDVRRASGQHGKRFAQLRFNLLRQANHRLQAGKMELAVARQMKIGSDPLKLNSRKRLQLAAGRRDLFRRQAFPAGVEVHHENHAVDLAVHPRFDREGLHDDLIGIQAGVGQLHGTRDVAGTRRPQQGDGSLNPVRPQAGNVVKP